MSSLFSMIKRISDIGLSNRELILKFRIVRSYTLPMFGKPEKIRSYEIVCHDPVGDRIHGTIRIPEYIRHEMSFLEGETLAFKFVVIEENNMKFKTTLNKYKFTTSSKTQIEFFNEDFPYYPFDFRPLSIVCDPSNLDHSLLLGKCGLLIHFSYFYHNNV